ncbi:MAG: hypothetical protein ABW252_23220 [Polyangiales bacterium]
MPLNWKCPSPLSPRSRAARSRRALGLVLALVACDEATPTSREAACMRYCEKLDLCDERTDRAGCVERCGDDRIRSDAYFAARASCVEARSCNLWWSEVDVMGVDVCDRPAAECTLNDCTSDTLAEAVRVPAQTAYCGRVASKLNACDPALLPVEAEAHCLALAPTLSELFLGAMQECIELPCERVATCVAAVRDRFNTDLTFTPTMSVPR